MLMSGDNPAWAASQLGHSMQMFLNVYARWIREADKGRELSKLEAILKATNKTTIDKNTPESQQNNSKCAKNKKPLVKWLYYNKKIGGGGGN
jgi:hypothetical protein